MAQAYIGTSGWNYRGWKDHFYGGAPQRRWLEICGEHFTAVEVNATFYRLQSPETFRKWRDQTPDGFRFAIKGNRYITHNKKLSGDTRRSIGLDRERAEAMGDKLAAVVWQLPRSLRQNPERLDAFATALDTWGTVRHAIEFRHDSWFSDETADCLRRHRIAVCQSDAADWPLWDAVTTDMVYVRLHGHTRTYASAYSDRLLDQWADRSRQWLSEGREVHVYFDNDSEGAAPHDADKLLAKVRGGG